MALRTVVQPFNYLQVAQKVNRIIDGIFRRIRKICLKNLDIFR